MTAIFGKYQVITTEKDGSKTHNVVNTQTGERIYSYPESEYGNTVAVRKARIFCETRNTLEQEIPDQLETFLRMAKNGPGAVAIRKIADLMRSGLYAEAAKVSEDNYYVIQNYPKALEL